MKLHFLDRSSRNYSSLKVTHDHDRSFLRMWHYHQELELVIILKSTGTRFVGDSIEKFQPGEVVLLGENLPHMWLNDAEYYNENSKLKAEAIAVHFKVDFLGADFFKAPELDNIANLLHRSRQGLLFPDLDKKIKKKIKKILSVQGVDRITGIIQVLDLLSEQNEYTYLASQGFANSFDQKDSNNLRKVYEYIFKNFNGSIGLNQVAEVAQMNPSAFSRFFKKVHNKPFTRYLNEIRIGYACKLLIEEKHKMITICFDAGFNNLSNFNRQFKLIRGMSPTEFMKFYKEKASKIKKQSKKSISL
ncbi:AraC family transcriptional regulator [Gramella sp. AN32]|uniref:AraC family transcriptional regulator n=1 Tax=Christiangramia antarctica TaxID=2058158 RepID=A0ABW5X2M1_9FLAO|nr:AraC family transcriptional regulator [Gramella sp. AN32]MCM4156920.1 AraC family transcriptional regulator [Gramella sp. AN32]